MPGSNREIVDLFPKQLQGDEYQCSCGVKRKQAANNSVTNLMSHITTAHEDYKEIEASKSSQMKLHSTEVSEKGMTIYKWLEWTIMDNHPFNFCENELTRQNTNLQDFSADSLVCYLEKTTEKIEQKIKEILPEKFC